MGFRGRYPFEDSNVRLTFFLLLIGAGMVGLIFWFFTSLALDLSVGGSIWFFFLFVFILLFWLILTFIGLARLRQEYMYLKWVFLAITLSLILAILVLGVEHRPFEAGNLKFRLGAVPIFDIGNSGAEPEETVIADLSTVTPDVELDLREFVPVSVNQGLCGSCWANAAAMGMSSRKKMLVGRKSDSEFTCPQGRTDIRDWYVSPQFIIDADNSGVNSSQPFGKCRGNTISKAFQIVQQTGGAPSMDCVPLNANYSPNCSCGYSSGGQYFGEYICAHTDPFVATTCQDGSVIKDEDKTKVPAFRILKGEDQMEKELTKNGPIVCYVNYYEKDDGSGCAWSLRGAKSIFGQYSNFVTDSFVARPSQDGNEYTRGLFNRDASAGHYLTVSGYGKVNGVPYWQTTNSWGKEWGYKGHVKIEKGINAWNIEKECVGFSIA